MILQAEADPWAAAMQGSAGVFDRDKHRSGKGSAGGESSSSLLSASSSTSTRFWTSAAVAFAFFTCALQIQFFRSAHRAATTTATPTSLSLALLRHDVIDFDPPPDFPADPTIVDVTTPRAHDEETAAATAPDSVQRCLCRRGQQPLHGLKCEPAPIRPE